MKVAALKGEKKIVVEKREDLEGKQGYILIDVLKAGICGSDMTFYTCAQSASMAMYPIPCSR